MAFALAISRVVVCLQKRGPLNSRPIIQTAAVFCLLALRMLSCMFVTPIMALIFMTFTTERMIDFPKFFISPFHFFP